MLKELGPQRPKNCCEGFWLVALLCLLLFQGLSLSYGL